MTDHTQENRVYELKKKISSIEWDINLMPNTELRSRKEAQLAALRSELKDLLSTAGSSDT